MLEHDFQIYLEERGSGLAEPKCNDSDSLSPITSSSLRFYPCLFYTILFLLFGTLLSHLVITNPDFYGYLLPV